MVLQQLEKKKKKHSSWKFKKRVWIFSRESDCQIWILRKGYVEQQLDGVFHATVGTKVEADDATLRFFCAIIWFRLMFFFFFPGFWFVWIELQVPVAFWNFLVLELIWFLFVMKNFFLDFLFGLLLFGISWFLYVIDFYLLDS